jgi:hypothetical protein
VSGGDSPQRVTWAAKAPLLSLSNCKVSGEQREREREQSSE